MRLNLMSKYFVLTDVGKIGWTIPAPAFAREPSELALPFLDLVYADVYLSEIVIGSPEV